MGEKRGGGGGEVEAASAAAWPRTAAAPAQVQSLAMKNRQWRTLERLASLHRVRVYTESSHPRKGLSRLTIKTLAALSSCVITSAAPSAAIMDAGPLKMTQPRKALWVSQNTGRELRLLKTPIININK